MTGYTAIERAAAEVGLLVRGGFHVADADGVPAMADGRPARTLVLLGNIGSSLWPAFSASAELHDGADHPLDRWTRRVAGTLAGRFAVQVLYPFGGPPHWPFQRWAVRAESVHASPLGLLIDPEFGLWHAYRAALLLPDRIALPPRDEQPSPCTTCADKPCLSTCPVEAFTGKSYDVDACAAHIALPAGADCMTQCCRARRACPAGRQYAYEPDHARFHMAAFLRSRQGTGR